MGEIIRLPMGKVLGTTNVVLMIFLVVLVCWMVNLIQWREGLPMRVKMYHEGMQTAFFLSGLTASSPFPFSRWITRLLPTTPTDEKTSFSLHVPSLQPHRAGDQVPIRLYVPSSPKSIKGKVPVIVWMHGGGFVFGSVAEYSADRLARTTAQQLGVYVVAVDYSLAPEHPFPDGLEDCYAVLAHLELATADWIRATGNFSHHMPMSLSHVFVGGVGAGANLAFHSTLLWEDRRLSNKELLPSKLQHHHTHSTNRLKILANFLVTPDMMMSPPPPEYYTSELVLQPDTSDILRRLYLNASSQEEALRLMEDPFVGMTNIMEVVAKGNVKIELFSLSPSLYHQEVRYFHENMTELGGPSAMMTYFQNVQGEIYWRQDILSSYIHRFWSLLDNMIAEY